MPAAEQPRSAPIPFLDPSNFLSLPTRLMPEPPPQTPPRPRSPFTRHAPKPWWAAWDAVLRKLHAERNRTRRKLQKLRTPEAELAYKHARREWKAGVRMAKRNFERKREEWRESLLREEGQEDEREDLRQEEDARSSPSRLHQSAAADAAGANVDDEDAWFINAHDGGDNLDDPDDEDSDDESLARLHQRHQQPSTPTRLDAPPLHTMASSWHFQALLPPYTLPAPITALAFDPYSELLWTGNASGQVTSLWSAAQPTRYTSFNAHRPSPVKELLVDDRGVVSLGERSVKGTKRTGVGRWILSEPRFSLNSMCSQPRSSEVVAGGAQLSLVVINTNSGSIVRKADVTSPLLFLQAGPRNSVICGHTDGNISLRDTRTTMSAQHTVQAHRDGLLGLESSGNLLLSWGCTTRLGRTVPDPLVKIYDVRTLKPLAPVSFPSGPAFVRVHPRLSTTIVVADMHGSFQVTDISMPGPASYHQVELPSYLTSMAISPAGNHLAFGDADGQIHLLTDLDPEHEPGTFNQFEGLEPEWPDVPEPLPNVDWNARTPLNSIGMPYYNAPLLSSMPLHTPFPDTSPLFNPAPPIPPIVMSSLRTGDFPANAPNPIENRGRRNLAYRRPGKSGNPGTGRRNSEPRFRSEQAKERIRRGGVMEEEDQADSAPAAPDSPSAVHFTMPKHYRKVEIKYSKFGVEDFDFGFYNKTRYSGLETHIANSYTNALLQVLHYTRPIRAVATAHIALPDPRENCLLAEAGFLFRMLEDGKGVNCQASNFSRALSSVPQAKALGLIDYESDGEAPYGSMIQNFNRFLLEQMAVESAAFQPSPHLIRNDALESRPASSPITQVLGIEATTVSSCTDGCGTQAVRDGTTHVVDMMYPRKTLSNEAPLPTDFCSILRASIIRDNFAKHTCPITKRYVPLHTRRILTSPGGHLPPVIAINAAVHTPEHLGVWLNPAKPPNARPEDTAPASFLPTCIGMQRLEDDVVVTAKEHLFHKDTLVYHLRAVIVQIQSEREPAHLVSIVRIPDDLLPENATSPWFIFNDFLVRNISERDALTFTTWKVPSVVYYERSNSQEVLNYSALPRGIDPSILYQDFSISWDRDESLIKHEVLGPDEVPGKGTLVAIDAEFVAMNKEEVEFRSDGTKSVIRPSRLSLARVSVLRGDGPKQRVPFIDDYIHTSEAVVDYLTEFSGINPGDLDPNTSPHTLVPLKVAYRKLRLLVDLGCVFVGHGLAKDFRIINIYVPPEQIIDTVDLYQKKGNQRKLSLRFLSWFLLKQDIQQASHDSIEDARSALLLYKMYKAFEADGRLDDVLDDIYAEGRRLNWKPPAPHVPTTAEILATPSAFPPLPTTSPRQPPRLVTPWHQQPGKPGMAMDSPMSIASPPLAPTPGSEASAWAPRPPGTGSVGPWRP